jgi:hypothetical protein
LFWLKKPADKLRVAEYWVMPDKFEKNTKSFRFKSPPEVKKHVLAPNSFFIVPNNKQNKKFIILIGYV